MNAIHARFSLKDVTTSIDYGVTASASSDANVGPQFLRITDIQDDRVDWNTVPFCETSAKEEAAAILCPDDIVFARTGATTGKSFLIRTCPERAVFASYLIRVRPNRSRVVPRYLSWYFQTPDYWRQVTSSASGTAQSGVNASKLGALSVPLPPLPEQRRIADILDKADAVRRKRKESIALTESLLRSTFLEMFGDPVTNPKGWEVKALGELLSMPLRNGLSPASGGAHTASVLTLSAITRGAFNVSAVKQGAFAMEPSNDVRLDQRDFLICRGNGNLAMVGSGAFPNSSDSNVVFPDTMIAARVNEEVISRAFLTAIWKSSIVRRQIEAGARTTNGTFKVNQNLIESVEFPSPDLRKQHAFAAIAQRISKVAERHGQSVDKAHELFDALVQQAFSEGGSA
jgi:type I restriction enzyme, S subunit